jgi:hypothetical protein
MASGRLVTIEDDQELPLQSGVHVFVERATEFKIITLLDFSTDTPRDNIGDWAIEQFDFRSTEWEYIAFIPEDVPIRNLYYKDEDSKLWQLHVNQYAITITNPHFVMPQEVIEQKQEPEDLDRPLVLSEDLSQCQPIACSNVLRDYVLDTMCLPACRESILRTIFDILNLFADNRVFIKDDQDRTFELNTFDVMVLGENVDKSYHIIKSEANKNAGQRAITTFDFTRSDWILLSIVFRKSGVHSRNHATLMWVQTDEKPIFIKGFEESETTISVRIPNPWNLDMEIPE